MEEASTKDDIYAALSPIIDFSFRRESDLIANLSNTIAIIHSSPLPFLWTGFYLVKGNELVLGPFQGFPTTTRIDYGMGVCGISWKEQRTLLVPNVHLFEGYIASNCITQSKIVVPIVSGGCIVAVLNIESNRLDDFDELDQKYLEEIAGIIGEHWASKIM